MPYENYESWKKNPITEDPYLSVIIPAYNEEVRIVPTIGAVASHISDLGFPWELIVVDNKSTDKTVELVRDLGLANLRLIQTATNSGKGGAVKEGMLAAKGKIMLFTDADNSTPIEEVNNFIQAIEKDGNDVVIGSRATEGAQTQNKSLLRKALSNGLNMIVRYGLGFQIRDTQCGFKMFTREAARRLHTMQTILGFSFDLEILYLAFKNGYKVKEMPVNWVDAPGSKVNARKEVQRFIRDIMKIRRNDRQWVYQNIGEKPENKLRIALVSTYPPGKGSLNEYAYHYVKHLREKSEVGEVIILADELPEGQSYPEDDITEGLAPLRIRTCWKFGKWNNFLKIRQAVRGTQPDVVLFNLQFASFADKRIPGALGLLSPWFAKSESTISSVLLHNIMETVDLKKAGFGGNPIIEIATRLAGNLFTRMILKADLVTVTIPKYVQVLTRKYKADNVILTPHGAFEELPEPSYSLPEGPKQIMTFGKFGTYKKVEALIEAFELLQDFQNEPIELVIAGTNSPNTPGYLEDVQKRYTHVKNVRYTGYVEEEDVPRIFQEAAVVVFPYNSTTGSSGVLHQAGMYGKAVALPNLGDFAELIMEEGYTGEFFKPDNPESMAISIAKFLAKPEHLKEIGHKNFLAAVGLPISDVIDWYILHFEQLLKDRGLISVVNPVVVPKTSAAVVPGSVKALELTMTLEDWMTNESA